MRPAAPDPEHEPLEEGAFAACLATILEIPIGEVPAPESAVDLSDGWRRWLAGRGLGLVRVAGATEFAWPGPWIGRLRPGGGEPARAVVMFGVPSGVAWDPTGVSEAQGWALEDGFVIAALDVALAAPAEPPPVTGPGVVEAICLAPRAEAAVREVRSARALPGRGLEGDRHVDGLGTFPSGVSGSALTLIDVEVLESFADEGHPPLSPGEHRRNVVTRGIDVNALVGRDFTIGEVRCRGARLCEPCSHLQRLTERRILRELVHRGGLRADIVTAGEIQVGDSVRAVHDSRSLVFAERLGGQHGGMSSQPDRPLALVTGASSGIGLELAKQFAENGFDLIVAAEDPDIASAADAVGANGASVDAVRVDLATDDGVHQLHHRVKEAGRPLDAAALNAGVGQGGAFATGTDIHDELRLIDLNVRSTVHLAKHVVRPMVDRGEGRILFTSSIASTMPGSFQAVYNASKSFVQSFALALRNELKDTGVTVTSLMPGPTETEFFERADMLDTNVGSGDKDDPADVARDGFEAMMAGQERVVSASLSTKVQGRASRLMPDGAKAEMHRRMAEPGSGEG